MRRHANGMKWALILGLFVVFLLGGLLLIGKKSHHSNQTISRLPQQPHQKKQTPKTSQKSELTGLPKVSVKDWDLILVNRNNRLPELHPDVTAVAGVWVDSRIAQNVRDFLAAAQAIDPREHLISGYRSVAYQKQLFQFYVNQEMTADNNLTEPEAVAKVETYSQPAGASEHQTGLAIDMSTVNSLNESNPEVVAQVVALAPRYGFVLRFPRGKVAVTGVDYEDWHFRYVGQASASYMMAHHLTLEEYLDILKGIRASE